MRNFPILWRADRRSGLAAGRPGGGADLHDAAQFHGRVFHYYTNSDGAYPAGRINFIGQHPVWDGVWRRQFGYGTVFAVSTDGTGFTILHSFGYRRRSFPGCRIDFVRATLCMELHGRRSGSVPPYGTVFAVNTDGTAFTILHGFWLRSDGAFPEPD